MKTGKIRTVTAGRRKDRGVFPRLLIFLITAGVLVFIFTAGAKFLTPGPGNSIASLLRYTLPMAFLCSFPFAALKKSSGGNVISAVLILIISFVILYAAMPGLMARPRPPAVPQSASPYSVTADKSPGFFSRVQDGFLFSTAEKTIHIATNGDANPSDDFKLRIRETDSAAGFASEVPPRDFPLAPVIGDIGYLNDALSGRLEKGNGPFALYLSALLLFSAGALLLSSISAWPAFNFFVCVLFTKLLLFMHRFFSSRLFEDVNAFVSRFTKLHASNVFLLGGGILFILMSLLHYSRRKGIRREKLNS